MVQIAFFLNGFGYSIAMLIIYLDIMKGLFNKGFEI